LKLFGSIAALTFCFCTSTLAAKYSEGANDKEIRIGNTSVYSGPVAVYGIISKTQAMVFKMINDNGGINGRKIVFISRDDGFNPANTVKQTRRLVEKDKVLFIYASIGTSGNLAIRPYLNKKKIPQLFILSNYSKFNDPKNYPWTIAGTTDSYNEAKALGIYLKKNKPDAKIGILYQNDDFGQDMLNGLVDELGDKANQIVMKQSYEITSPTVDSQIIKLHSSGADVFLNFATSRAAAQAMRKIYALGWKPFQYVSVASASRAFVLAPVGFEKVQGIMSFNGAKDISDSQYANDKDVKEYKAFMAKYLPDQDPRNTLVAFGYSYTMLLKHVLELAGDDLTRENIMKIATNLNFQLPLFLSGIHFITTPDNYLGFGIYQPAFFEGEFWKLKGDPIKIN